MSIILDGSGTGSITAGTISQANSIAFSATQVASADPNTLDDYEEVSYTPILKAVNGTDPTSVSYSIQQGHYTKIGRLVYVYGFIQFSTYTVGTGTVMAISLPFTASSSAATLLGGVTENITYPSGKIWPFAQTVQGGDYAYFNAGASGTDYGGMLFSANTSGATNRRLQVHGIYFV